MKKNVFNIIILILLVFLMSSCAPHTIDISKSIPPNVEPAGFWMGLWHGMILPITFLWSLFNHNITVYDVINNGAWYNLGFVLGAGALLGGSSAK